MLRAAILGYGRNGSTMHAGGLEGCKDFSVVAVCDIDAGAREKAANRFHCSVYEDYHEMLKKEELDLVVIVTRSSQHAQMTIDCLLAGCHVLVTKPWATCVHDAQRMIDAQKMSGKKLFPWLPARFGVDLRKLREIIESGEIGHVFEIRRTACTFGIRFDWQTESRYGGGYLLNWGPHLVDQPLQLAHAPVLSVYGNLRQIINHGDAEDNVRVITELEDGVTVISEFLIAAGSYPSWVIQGDRGTIYVHDHDITVHKIHIPATVNQMEYRSKVEHEEYSVHVDGNIFGDEHEIYPHIARALRDEEPYFVPLEDALLLSRILESARISSQEHREVLF